MPLVGPDQHWPEITVKAVVVSIVLAAILAAANAYLGLFAGMTVSASIPAAVTSMAILRLFRRHNVLENNIVQTAASSGEALAAGVIFTVPALVLIGYWEDFDYWRTAMMAAVGGLLGVLYTIPLRRALIVDAGLRFPEGLATAEVLKAGSAAGGTQHIRLLGAAAGLGAVAKLGEAGFKLWDDTLEGASRLAGTLLYGGVNLSPALIAVGFILGLQTAMVVCAGGLVGWLIIMPIDAWLHGLPPGLPADVPAATAAKALWSTRVRYVGIGAMLIGGLWSLVDLRRPILSSVSRLGTAYRHGAQAVDVPRTERDAPLGSIIVCLAGSIIPMAVIYAGVVESWPLAVGMTAVMAAAAFLFSSVAAYMAGLVGSSSNPVSGVTIATLMLASVLLVMFLGAGAPSGPAAALVIAAVVCCAAAMGGDNLQDLKTGHLLGATPWKQQIMQVIGVATGAIVLVPVLTLLQLKYGIGHASPAHPHPLPAPQATLMAGLATGVFGEGLPWPLVGVGVVLGIGVIVIDRRLIASGSAIRLPVLAVALGIYLPLKLSVAIVLGGVVAEAVRRRAGSENQRGVLCAAGLITGEALMGIVLAIPIALSGVWPTLGADPLALFNQPPAGPWPGVLVMTGILFWLFRSARSDS